MGILNDELNRIHRGMAKIADKYFGEGEKMEKCCENCSHFPIQSLADPRWHIICYEQCKTADFADVCEKWESIDTAIDTWIKEHPDK